jgi:hypothetical protein
MAVQAPPPPRVRLYQGDDDRLRRYRSRMTQIMVTLLTLVITVWICTFGAIPAILALMVAKHILVAVLVMGVGLDAPPA